MRLKSAEEEVTARVAAQRNSMITQPPRLIKKYPNRRLYDTQASAYITLGDVKSLVMEQAQFHVVDAKSGEDLTRSILLQIILDEEGGGTPILSSQVLEQIIRFYGHTMQGFLGSFLERNLQTFIDLQTRLKNQQAELGDTAKMSAEMWQQLLAMQAPALQGMVGNYLEQNARLFADMQGQFESQTRSMLQGFPFPPFPGQPETKADK
jgi:polyhydroxyalkanoate synthesis repressor PhaR